MSLEDTLRSFKLVKKHIMRTRRMTHENIKYRSFIEKNGLNADDIINDKMRNASFLHFDGLDTDVQKDAALLQISNALKVEKKRRAFLEAELYILRQDYHKSLISKSEVLSTNDLSKKQ